jgi:undecaprenyl-diphosphatase
MDVFLTQWINGLSGQSSLVDHLMILVSVVGVPVLVLIVCAQWWVRSSRQRVRHVIVASGLSFLIGLGANQIILMFYSRVRPYDAGVTQLLVERTTDPSFPSDHATASFAIAFAFLFHGLRETGQLFIVAASVVAFSRVYVGTHYVSDVLGGALTAAAAAAAVLVCYRPGTGIDRFITGIL